MGHQSGNRNTSYHAIKKNGDELCTMKYFFIGDVALDVSMRRVLCGGYYVPSGCRYVAWQLIGQ